jgi:hypothetical protein
MATNNQSVTGLASSVTRSVTSKTLKNQCCYRCYRCYNLARTCARENLLIVNNLLLIRAREPVTPVTPVTLLKNKEKTCNTSCNTLEKTCNTLGK